ncbi:MAG TPA: hypothetical protein PLF13_10555 [candidate division Zixibacteria bacterium]|nr:hypothetical protein [candidate division Zixibacteria bacterium]
MVRPLIIGVASFLFALYPVEARLVSGKVGTSGPSIYAFMPASTAALGLGHTGVITVAPGSEWANPALSIMSDSNERCTLYGTPFGLTYPELDDDASYQHYSLTYRLKVASLCGYPVRLSTSFAHTRYTSGLYLETTYDGYAGGTYREKIRSYQVSTALATDFGPEIALGGTVRYITEDLADWDVSGWGCDFGAMLRAPLSRWIGGNEAPVLIRPAVAVAWNNMGLKFDLEPFGEFDSPTNRSMGISLEIAALDRNQPFIQKTIGLTINYSGTKLLNVNDSTSYGVGAELCLVEALYLRLGKAFYHPYEPTTYGFELDSDGLRMLLASLSDHEAKKWLSEQLSGRHIRLSIAYSTHGGDTVFDDGSLVSIALKY